MRLTHPMIRNVTLAGALALCPGAGVAHPHIFIDAGLRLIVEDGQVTAIEVTWLYDGLYSLILLEDYGLDPDFDLALTEEEVATHLGFDLNWNSGFTGGLELRRGDADLEIGAPEAMTMELVGEGQLRTTHRRPVTDVDSADALVAQAYDPEFYIAFEMTGDMTAEGAACVPELVRADLDAAYAVLEEAISEIGGAVAAEDNFPPVGAAFADQVIFTCDG